MTGVVVALLLSFLGTSVAQTTCTPNITTWTKFSMAQGFDQCWRDYLYWRGGAPPPPPPGRLSQLMLNKEELTKQGSAGAAIFEHPVPVLGFEMVFTLEITNLTGIPGNHSAGMAFIIHNDPTFRINSIKAASPGMNYGDASAAVPQGINFSLAIEFDTHKDDFLPVVEDPDSNHVGVHSRAQYRNNADEQYLIPGISGDKNQYVGFSNMVGNVVTWTVRYEPSVVSPGKPGLLTVTKENVAVPGISLHFDMRDWVPNLINGQKAYVGFTASTDQYGGEAHYVHDWTYEFLGVPNPKNSQPGGPGVGGAVAGADTQIVVQLVDQYFNVYNSYAVSSSNSSNVTFSVNIDKPHKSKIWYNATGNGRYIVTYNVEEAGQSTITILIAGDKAGGRDVTPTIIPGDLVPSLSKCTGCSTAKLLAGVYQNVTISTFDQYMNPTDGNKKKASIVVDYQGPPNAVTHPQQFNYGGDGKYLVTFGANTEGDYNVSFTIDNMPITALTFPLSVKPNKPHGPSCQANGPGLSSTSAGSETGFNVTLFDAYNNSILFDLEDVHAKFTIKNQTKREFFDDHGVQRRHIDVHAKTLSEACSFNGSAQGVYVGKGVYSFQYTCFLAGVHPLTITLNDSTPVDHSPYSVQVLPNNTVNNGDVKYPKDWSGTKPNVTVSDSFFFLVQVLDSWNNKITDCSNVKSNVILRINTVETKITQKCVHGLLNITFSETIAREIELDIFLTHNIGKKTLNVIPGPVAAAKSVAVGVDDGKVYSGQPASFKVIANDKFGNAVGKGNSTFDCTITPVDKGNHAVIGKTAKDNGDGTYTVQYTAADSGHYKISVKYAGEDIEGSPFDINAEWAGLPNSTILAIGLSVLAAVILIAGGFLYYRHWKKKKFYRL